MPQRTPTKRKKLTGNHRNDRARPRLPTGPIDARPSADLDAVAQAEYKRIVTAFAKTGRLTELDETILSLYCVSFSRWKHATRALATEGEVIWVEVCDTHGKVVSKKPVVNPLSKVVEGAARAVHRYGDALGLSPAARTKQGFELEKEKDEEDDEFAEFTQFGQS
jgi:P27 family predicted phage terminase small subunit